MADPRSRGRWHAYLGEIFRDGVHHPAKHKAIIAHEVFARAQALRAARLHVGRVTPSGSAAYLLSQLVVCEECGSPMVGQSATGSKGGMYRYYTCRGRLEGWCNSARIEAEILDDKVLDALQEALKSSDFPSAAMEMAQGQIETEGSEGVAELRSLDQDLTKAHLALDRLRGALDEDPALDMHLWWEERTPLEERIHRLEVRRAELTALVSAESEGAVQVLEAEENLAEAVSQAKKGREHARLQAQFRPRSRRSGSRGTPPGPSSAFCDLRRSQNVMGRPSSKKGPERAPWNPIPRPAGEPSIRFA